MNSVAIVGYGRFGRTLGALAAQQGLVVRAWDEDERAVPDDVRAASLAECVRGADIVALAVPVDALPGVLARVAPLVESARADSVRADGGGLVLDVCSVKVGPEQALRAALADRVPWAATHPLFGPTSAAEAGRALKAVVVPNLLVAGATTRARAFYERLGCAVVELDADAHDRLMAQTQQIAFFVGAALRDAGLGAAEPWGPPSADALARLAGGVTGEGGHVRAAILGQNPHAAAARRRLLDAAQALDAALGGTGVLGRATGPAPSPVAASMAAAAPTSDAASTMGAPSRDTSPGLDALRGRIDDVDQRLLALLAERAAVARDISRAKALAGRPVRDLARETQALAARRAWATAQGVDADFAARMFEDVFAWSRAVQEEDRR